MDDLDLRFANISREQAIQKYISNLSKLQNWAAKNNVNRDLFQLYVLRQFHPNKVENKYLAFYKVSSKYILKQLAVNRKFLLNLLFMLFTIVALQSYKDEMSSLFIRKIQHYIYPSMRILRKASISVLNRNPQISVLYDENCLVANPYFQVNEVDCDNCQRIVNILEVPATNQQFSVMGTNNIPFFMNTESNVVTTPEMYKFFKDHKNDLLQDPHINKVTSSNENVKNLDDMFVLLMNNTRNAKHHTSHNIWRCNSMKCARPLREILPRSNKFPTTGMGIERFLIFDTKDAPSYKLPDSECDTSFISQVSGFRTIILWPAAECRNNCRKLSITLSPRHTLFFNWWYYKPISMPNQNANADSISYVGSYC